VGTVSAFFFISDAKLWTSFEQSEKLKIKSKKSTDYLRASIFDPLGLCD
jgi:hypothetical protein